MSVLQARQAALELQQELAELDLDVELDLKPIKKNFGVDGNQPLETVVLNIDTGYGPKNKATIFIAEDGTVWGKRIGHCFSVLFNGVMAFNSSTPWNAAKLALGVSTSMPQLRASIATQERLLNRWAKPKK